MQQVIKAIDSINRVVGILLSLMLGVMSILIILQVISRFVINFPLTWSEELSRYLMIYIVFLGAGLAMRHNNLISIELLPESLSGNKRKVVIILVMIISIIFFAILFKQGIDMLGMVKMQSSPGLQLSMSIPYASIPIGSFVLAINSLAVILDQLSNKQEGEI
ncbi:TRAP transporter small permease [Heyndrickxia sp. MSNUG]|uniref:TRAP transporter small permease n=1 Tax=Heyndrickxia sp. MSNUG TaxID=3136677 RepID=UPI003C2D0D7B